MSYSSSPYFIDSIYFSLSLSPPPRRVQLRHLRPLKLVRNYRSHREILKLPNELFYDGDLVGSADITRSHRFVDWEHLPKRGFPVMFHGIEGEDTRESNSPSWFNPDEAQIVKMYVELLVKQTRRNRCKPEDIGVIAPYHRQVQKIRMLLGAHGYSDCKVGSVEEFQGSERPVIIISTVRSTVDYISFDMKHRVSSDSIPHHRYCTIISPRPMVYHRFATWCSARISFERKEVQCRCDQGPGTPDRRWKSVHSGDRSQLEGTARTHRRRGGLYRRRLHCEGSAR